MEWDLPTRIRVESVVQAQRAFRTETRGRAAPSATTIMRLVNSFHTIGSILRKTYTRRPSPQRTLAFARVKGAIDEEPHTSTRKLSQQTKISRSTVQRVLHQELGLYPYKVQLVQKLHRGDKTKRWQFCKWFAEKCQNDTQFLDNFIMTDEATFHLNSFVNKQNCRIWATKNPHAVEEEAQFSPSITVWCAVSAKRIIGPYFFEQNGLPVTVNGSRYREILETFFLPELRRKKVPFHKIWFQQEGATAHTASKTIDLLKRHFGQRVVSKNGPVNWPPRSPDLTAPDFFLWGCVKSIVYETQPRNLSELKSRIVECMEKISLKTKKATIEDALPKRCEECARRHGSHLDDVVFRQ